MRVSLRRVTHNHDAELPTGRCCSRSKFGRVRPKSVEIGSSWAESGRKLAEVDKISRTFGRCRLKLSLIWSSSARAWAGRTQSELSESNPRLAELGTKSDEIGPSLAESLPSMAGGGRTCLKHCQSWPPGDRPRPLSEQLRPGSARAGHMLAMLPGFSSFLKKRGLRSDEIVC